VPSRLTNLDVGLIQRQLFRVIYLCIYSVLRCTCLTNTGASGERLNFYNGERLPLVDLFTYSRTM